MIFFEKMEGFSRKGIRRYAPNPTIETPGAFYGNFPNFIQNLAGSRWYSGFYPAILSLKALPIFLEKKESL